MIVDVTQSVTATSYVQNPDGGYTCFITLTNGKQYSGTIVKNEEKDSATISNAQIQAQALDRALNKAMSYGYTIV